MKQSGNLPIAKKIPPFQLTPYFWAIFWWPPSLSKFQKREPSPLILGREENMQWWYWHETWTSNYTSKKKQNSVKTFDGDVMLVNYNVIIIFVIYSQFGAIRKPDSRLMVCKTYIFIKSNLLSYKTWKQN